MEEQSDDISGGEVEVDLGSPSESIPKQSSTEEEALSVEKMQHPPRPEEPSVAAPGGEDGAQPLTVDPGLLGEQPDSLQEPTTDLERLESTITEISDSVHAMMDEVGIGVEEAQLKRASTDGIMRDVGVGKEELQVELDTSKRSEVEDSADYIGFVEDPGVSQEDVEETIGDLQDSNGVGNDNNIGGIDDSMARIEQHLAELEVDGLSPTKSNGDLLEDEASGGSAISVSKNKVGIESADDGVVGGEEEDVTIDDILQDEAKDPQVKSERKAAVDVSDGNNAIASTKDTPKDTSKENSAPVETAATPTAPVSNSSKMREEDSVESRKVRTKKGTTTPRAKTPLSKRTPAGTSLSAGKATPTPRARTPISTRTPASTPLSERLYARGIELMMRRDELSKVEPEVGPFSPQLVTKGRSGSGDVPTSTRRHVFTRLYEESKLKQKRQEQREEAAAEAELNAFSSTRKVISPKRATALYERSMRMKAEQEKKREKAESSVQNTYSPKPSKKVISRAKDVNDVQMRAAERLYSSDHLQRRDERLEAEKSVVEMDGCTFSPQLVTKQKSSSANGPAVHHRLYNKASTKKEAFLQEQTEETFAPDISSSQKNVKASRSKVSVHQRLHARASVTPVKVREVQGDGLKD